MGVRGDLTDGAVHDQTGRTVGGDYDPQFADCGMAVAAGELGVPARDRADPTLLKLCSQQVINQIRVIEGRLPGGVTVLKRDDRCIRRFGRKENFARRDGRPNAQGDAVMQDAEEIHIRITADDGQTVPEVEAEGLASIHSHKLGPCIVRLNPKESAKVRTGRGQSRNGQVLAGRHHVRQNAREETRCLQTLQPKGAKGTEEVSLTRQAPEGGA